MRVRDHIYLAFGMVVVAALADPRVARACGCLSPPAVAVGEFAVNQSAEQIIFETEPNWVTAHVLIKYAGDPAKFAWIVPVPEVPELGISPVSAFGLLDQLTAPDVTVQREDICPVSEWQCRFHDPISCPGSFDQSAGSLDAGASFGDAAGGGGAVTVISEQVVGDYQTVTFRASEAAAAVQWLRDNGFIVNQTTSIYMESYVQANMVFVAAKLVPGAGIRAIKPLRMRYRAAYPMVPLVLTAVAAEPHLTVTTYVYGSKAYRPMGHPIVSIDANRLSVIDTRNNYPMVLARTIDEAGGDGFAVEYRGGAPRPEFNQQSFCCGNDYDFCNLGGDQQCQCPRDEFDRADCIATNGDLVDGVALLDQLRAKYSTVTRLTTRVSAEEMNFDPQFEPDFNAPLGGKLVVRGSQPVLAQCASAVIDQDRFAQLSAIEQCATTYCGPGGQCVATSAGAACACEAGFVSQRFTDLDNRASVTCVPRVPPVDLRANGEQLPDACAGVSCGMGTCIDRNGVAVCDCDGAAAAIPGSASAKAPRCEPITLLSHTPGAQDFSEPLRELQVCAPPPPTCGADGWLVKTQSPRPGVDCGNTQPAHRLTVPGPPPTCGWFSCGDCSAGGSGPLPPIAISWVVLALIVRRRRGRG